ncbi:MAG: hypothetical protein OES09_07585 [Gammaproteobacteria bacterium]|nr:hypothetical protein [Gammaproteobacteria bacterium]
MVAMVCESVFGWDLGGAHVKAVLLKPGRTVEHIDQRPCPLWQGIEELDTALERILDALPVTPRRHAVTMTGELVDAFANRAAGVRALVDGINRRLRDREVYIYGGRAGFLTPAGSIARPDDVASANWMASATLIAMHLRAGILIDIGSTTTDIIPFADGRLQVQGYRDHERMQRGELVYSGVVRTPVMAITRTVPFAGTASPLMAEHFATTADVYRILGTLPEQADSMPAADERAKTPQASAVRLARMLGMDAEGVAFDVWIDVARYLRECQLGALLEVCRRMLDDLVHDPAAPIVGAGVGRFLVRELAAELGRPYVDFGRFFRSAGEYRFSVADCAPAAAVACLLDA